MSELTFVCCECGEEFAVEYLSQDTVEEVGASSQEEAVTLEPNICMCVFCADVIETDDDMDFGRNESESWEFSGVRVDPGMQVFYNNNY